MKTKTATTQPKIKDVRLCTDDEANEAIYVDGKLKAEKPTFYMWEVAKAAGRGPVKLRHHNIDNSDDESNAVYYQWPKRFSDLKVKD